MTGVLGCWSNGVLSLPISDCRFQIAASERFEHLSFDI